MVTELQLLKQMSHWLADATVMGGSKLLKWPPAGSGLASPVPPNATPFQLQRTGAVSPPATWAHAVALYGYIAQS